MTTEQLVYRVAPHREQLAAVVDVPGSKSIANRALVCAALAEGESVLTRVPGGDDTEAMLACLRLLGLPLDRAGTTVTIDGGRQRLLPGPLTLPTRLAGTTSRFLTALAALGPGPYTIDGEPPLRRRPMAPLHNALTALGVNVTANEAAGCLPVTVQGPIGSTLTDVSIAGDVSSQYLTALMLIGPYLASGLRIRLTSTLVSRPYVEMTAAVMGEFGVRRVEVGDGEINVPAGEYTARHFAIEPDASSASYPLAAAAVCGGRVRVPGLVAGSLQGDAEFATVLAAMGCEVVRDSEGTEVRRSGPLHGIDIDMADISDLVPTMAAIAPYADSPVEVHGVGFIRAKESDRLGDLCAELRRAGVDAKELADGLVIRPGAPRAARLRTHHDHRLAMSFAVLGLGLAGDEPIEIENPGVVSKSWPEFWTMVEALS